MLSQATLDGDIARNAALTVSALTGLLSSTSTDVVRKVYGKRAMSASRSMLAYASAACGIFFAFVFLHASPQTKAAELQTWEIVSYVFVGALAVLSLSIGLVGWTVLGKRGLHTHAVRSRKFLVLDNAWLGFFLILALPGFFLIVRSLWHPIMMDPHPLHLYVWMLGKAVDIVTLGALDSFEIELAAPPLDGSALSPAELISFNYFVGSTMLSIIGSIAFDSVFRNQQQATVRS